MYKLFHTQKRPSLPGLPAQARAAGQRVQFTQSLPAGLTRTSQPDHWRTSQATKTKTISSK